MCVCTAENSTVTESEVDTEVDTDKDSVIDRLKTLLYISDIVLNLACAADFLIADICNNKG